MSARPRICATVMRPTGTTTPIQLSPACFCAWMPIWAVRSNGGRGATAPGTARSSLRPSFSSMQREEFLDAQAVEHVFQPRLGAVGAVAVIDEHAHHRVGDLRGVGGLHQHAGVAREIVCPVMPPRQSRNQTPGSRPKPSFTCDGLEADVVGVFQHRNDAGAVEGDVELARQAVERAVVEDVEVPFARIRPRVDQLLRVDAGGRRAGDVADIVGAGAARAEAEILDRLDHGDGVRRPRSRGSADWRAW